MAAAEDPENYLAVTKKKAFSLTSHPKLVQRWLYWTRRAKTPQEKWVIIAREGGRGVSTLIDYASLREAYERYLRGEEPPPLPSQGGAE